MQRCHKSWPAAVACTVNVFALAEQLDKHRVKLWSKLPDSVKVDRYTKYMASFIPVI